MYIPPTKNYNFNGNMMIKHWIFRFAVPFLSDKRVWLNGVQTVQLDCFEEKFTGELLMVDGPAFMLGICNGKSVLVRQPRANWR